MNQDEFDRRLGEQLSSPIPTLLVLAGVAAFVLVGWLTGW